MKAIPLTVAGAFHTPLMEPAVARLRAALASTEFRQPRSRCCVTPMPSPTTILPSFPELLERQVVCPVLWEDSMRRLIDELGVDAVL